MIKYLVMDVDGTLTDGKVYIGNQGEEFKAFSIKDGCGIHDILPKCKMEPIIVTGRKSKIVELRCQELGISKLFQGVKNKIDIVRKVSENELKCVAYIGDDLNDLECMKAVKDAGGIIGCPQNAVKAVVNIANFVSSYNGGEGAVREFIEWLADINKE